MGKLSGLATITVKDGRGDELIDAFRGAAEHVAKEDGTEHYVLHRNNTDPNVFYVTEVYSDQAAYETHTSGAALAALGPALADIVEGFSFELATPVLSAGGLEL
jgi:quinol monooxygenase YgiN